VNAPARLSVHALLAQARVGLDRLTPVEAYEAVRAGAVLIDIRPTLSRNAEGRVPGALVIERNELEWRLDPASEASIPQADYEMHAVLMCNEGYASSLAAAALQQLGIHRGSDVIGGFRSWRAVGLPTTTGYLST